MDKEKMENWVSINLPEGCPNICISFDRETAEKQTKEFGAKPLYGFEDRKEAWLPAEIFITYGGRSAPERGLDKLFRHYKVDPQEGIYGIGTMTKDCLDVAILEFVGDIAKRQRTIIDYDEDYDTILLRFLPMDYGGKDPGVKSKAKETGKIERTLTTPDKGRAFQKEELDRLKKQLEVNRARIPEDELKTKYKLAYEKILKEIAELEEAIGGEQFPSGSKMNQEDLEAVADSMLLNLAEQGLTCKEAVKAMQIADGKIRKSRSALFKKADKTSLKAVLRETKNALGKGQQDGIQKHI